MINDESMIAIYKKFIKLIVINDESNFIKECLTIQWYGYLIYLLYLLDIYDCENDEYTFFFNWKFYVISFFCKYCKFEIQFNLIQFKGICGTRNSIYPYPFSCVSEPQKNVDIF